MIKNKLLSWAWTFAKKHWIFLLLIKILWGILIFILLKKLNIVL